MELGAGVLCALIVHPLIDPVGPANIEHLTPNATPPGLVIGRSDGKHALLVALAALGLPAVQIAVAIEHLPREGHDDKCQVHPDEGDQEDEPQARPGLLGADVLRRLGHVGRHRGALGECRARDAVVLRGRVAGRPGVALESRAVGEPAESEGGRVGGVQEGVDDVDPGEAEDFEWRLLADMRQECADQQENGDRVEVHGELEKREGVSCQDREQAVEARELVEDERQGDDLGAILEADDAEERLRRQRRLALYDMK